MTTPNPASGVVVTGTGSSSDWTVEQLVQPGLRRNPRRAHLLVSEVLGKHIPVDPEVVTAAADRLGTLVLDAVGGSDVVVLGFAETATGLGHGVAARLNAHCYLHSTRRDVPGIEVYGEFQEGHSHATDHRLLPTSADVLDVPLPLVLVDDEISTGKTALEAIRSVHATTPRQHYVIASLVDMRAPEHRAQSDSVAAELGVVIDSVSLAQGSVDLGDTLVDDVAALPEPQFNPVADKAGTVTRVDAEWPDAVPDGGRHGFLSFDTPAFEAAIARVAAQVDAALPPGAPIVVLGHEELMYLPLRLASILRAGGHPALFQTTTRSPAYVLDRPDYPLRRGFQFIAPEHGESEARYVYNASGPEDAILVLVVDDPADTERLFGEGGAARTLAASGSDVLVVVVSGADPLALTASRRAVPLTGPAFGSYAPHEVTWLLKDLSHVELEAGITERERNIQAGTAHYAESLPIEYQPDVAYRELFEKVLQESASRLAIAVGTVTEIVLAERGHDVVLASLARAGTPVGILMRRWAHQVHGLELPHYAVSIVRDRGIDSVALRYLADNHDPGKVVFVDGWTGKGAIARELTAALDAFDGPRFDPDLAVLADPGQCARTYGTRDDFLIASACLNSTVSGLVSRTVLNRDLIRDGEFHGAKYYADLAPDDVSNHLLDTVAAQFDAVRDDVTASVAAVTASDRTPTWSGWASVEKVRDEFGISHVNFVKPGVGETTRVLLRRVPWRILVRDIDAPEHEHIRMLAAARGVPVVEVPDLAYSCMGLIKDVT
ncbi:phosphoribosyltransferase domain-containing protein [Rhodococcus sp. BP-252]|uniref:phosphoribosyltransferase n=1 Tax=unclassified Rhodococcus (in: high G+C Gram-positive bacteria) TaxID=192944 RepID=UPI001C9AC4C4|nr:MULTISPECIES: phosphoribosyltransferase [unclassified Rhodococcus (in: high G+C Gram-positive bacteria)]MBY6413410.1 phosphoribosyltransferase domain-containing protein [Rhodococcus sp. BP-320]MBY6418104.1 phosphoribosyltransferase domain-containing protein [Rhodococcus sp. BP-321]MBY6422415.1 phosphoribosyltransferase domain-containing protein [Rhodococcus sp. BP-324]MBY6426385.1 phosphoribosyltransferase domain-containing protein [Rhodococcus sp. BP-323]MBY6431384.1 phosphoribosyltransfer